MANILFFAAHPDDLEVCAGGTIAKHVARGDHVDVIIGFSRNIDKDEGRSEELNIASDFLGYTYHIYYRQDMTTIRHALGLLEQRFTPKDYSRIYCMNNNDSHQEHQHMAQLAIAFCRDNLHDLVMCQAAIPGGVGPNVTAPNLFVNISDFIERKRESIECHITQVEKYSANNRAWVDSIIARDKANGMLIGVDYAEAFHVIKIIEV